MANTKASINSKKAMYRRNALKNKKNKIAKSNEVKTTSTKQEAITAKKKPNKKNNIFVTMGLICSVLGFLTCGISSILGIIFSIIGYKKEKKSNGALKKDAIAGIKVGIFSILVFLFIFLIVSVFSFKTKTQITNISKVKPRYKIDEEIKVENTYGDYSIKIVGIKETEDRNDMAAINPKKVIVIKYEYRNININEDLYINGARFSAYDSDNNLLQIYPLVYRAPEYISKGRKTQAEIVYALDNDDNVINLEFYKNTFDKKAYCIIELNW